MTSCQPPTRLQVPPSRQTPRRSRSRQRCGAPLRRMAREGVAAAIDFREEGRAGVELLRAASARTPERGLSCSAARLARPIDRQELANVLLAVADGIGLSSARDESCSEPADGRARLPNARASGSRFTRARRSGKTPTIPRPRPRPARPPREGDRGGPRGRARCRRAGRGLPPVERALRSPARPRARWSGSGSPSSSERTTRCSTRPRSGASSSSRTSPTGFGAARSRPRFLARAALRRAVAMAGRARRGPRSRPGPRRARSSCGFRRTTRPTRS